MEIHWRHPECFSERERDRAESRLETLARDHTDLLEAHIAARPSGHHRHGGQEVRITCHARGAELMAARTHADLGLALNEALDALAHEVWRMRHRRTQHWIVPLRARPRVGVIDRIFSADGYGTIVTEAGERVYFHRNALSGGLAFERLEQGQRVGVSLEGGVDGTHATAVLPAPAGAQSA